MQNRCLAGHGGLGFTSSGFTRVKQAAWAIFLVIGLAFCVTTQAQVEPRKFPPTALRGVLVVTQPPQITLNGLPAQLSPGARIRAPNNLLVLSGTLLGQSLLVNYVQDAQGQIHEVWILTEAEAQEPRAGMPSYFQSDAVVPGQAR
jgi:hypothetical protein